MIAINLQMPTSCSECPFKDMADICQAPKGRLRALDCPLKEVVTIGSTRVYHNSNKSPEVVRRLKKEIRKDIGRVLADQKLIRWSSDEAEMPLRNYSALFGSVDVVVPKRWEDDYAGL